MKIKELLLEYLRESYEYSIEDISIDNIEHIELADFLFWIGNRVNKS